MKKETPEKTYPDCYLHVQELRSGEEWIVSMRGNSPLDLTRQVKKWIKEHFCGEFCLNGKIMSRIDGDYYGKIMTDGRPPESGICWEGGGFYVKSTYN